MRILRNVILTLAFVTVATSVVVEALDKIVLPATSGFSPALTSFNGLIRIAWTTKYEIRIREFDPGSKGASNEHGLGETSFHAPALAVFHKRLYIAWTGTDKDASLNVMSSQDGQSFVNKVTLPEGSAYGPALAVFNNRLYLAWTGADKQLKLISSADGVNFPPSRKQILGQSSIAGPALLVPPEGWYIPARPDLQTLFITWTGSDKTINVAAPVGSSKTGDPLFDFTTRFFTWQVSSPSSDPSIGPRETSNDRPVLYATPRNAKGDATIMLWFTGTDSRLNLIQVDVSIGFLATGWNFFVSGHYLGRKQTFDDTSIAGPAIADGWLAWTGTDDAHHLNIKLVK